MNGNILSKNIKYDIIEKSIFSSNQINSSILKILEDVNSIKLFNEIGLHRMVRISPYDKKKEDIQVFV